ncbi:MAG: carbonic anhydrase [Leptothrix sp. (in: b-proteobacteria)]
MFLLAALMHVRPVQAAEPAHGAKPAEEPAKAEALQPKSVSLDQLRDRLAEKVSAVREAQARTPTVRLSARTPTSRHAASTGHAAHAEPDAAALAAAHRVGLDAHERHWSYGGETGPAAWAELKPSFATCATGQRQSPIDIRGGLKVDLEPIKFDYRPTGFNVIDNGHTVQANLGLGNSIEVNGRRYELLQFHFHRPSEERINGRQYEMVVHLVHKDPEGRLAVVAVLLEQGRAHPIVQVVWNSLPLEKNEELTAPAPLDPSLLLPEDRRYYTYMGSLTTPPCSEGVLWLVLKQPVSLSPDQLALFARLYPMNARPTQRASDRLIKESN